MDIHRQDRYTKADERVRCAECCYARPDAVAPGNGYVWIMGSDGKYRKAQWSGIECGCADSDYFKSLLNVSITGDRQQRVTWSGCDCGERRRGE